jgi:hypothetical protein
MFRKSFLLLKHVKATRKVPNRAQPRPQTKDNPVTVFIHRGWIVGTRVASFVSEALSPRPIPKYLVSRITFQSCRSSGPLPHISLKFTDTGVQRAVLRLN